MKARQRSDYRRAVTKFAAWLAETKLSGAIVASTARLLAATCPPWSPLNLVPP
jgi:hypothetical protein